jgi:feruloyl esterase
MTQKSTQLRTISTVAALAPLWLLASCGGGSDSGTLMAAAPAEAVSVQAQGGSGGADGHGTQGGSGDDHGGGDRDDDCDHHGHSHGDPGNHDDSGGDGHRQAYTGGSGTGEHGDHAKDHDHDKHHGHGKKCKPPKPDPLPQLPPAQPAPLPVTCEQLALTLGVPAPAPAPAPFSGRVTALAVKPLAGGTPVPVPGPIPDTVITTTTTVPPGTLTVGGQPVAEHCVVTGKMLERVSPVDAKTYAIGFEMRLPKAWNGRFWYQANGGADGNVVTATGAFGGGPLTNALQQGFAVISSDAGHTAADGLFFGLDPQARLDYGYQAVGKLTPMAKKLIELAYGKAPDRSYIGGCSNGGRHTLVAAARYAADYDGFLAGAPGFNLPLAALANIFGAQQYATIATGDPTTPAGLETAFTAAERKTVAAAVLDRCDALDGETDGLVQDTEACQRSFRLFRDVPTCSGARDGTCLTLAQKIAIAPIFRGATLANGERFYAPFPYDSGLGGNGIPFWEFTAPLVLDSGAVGLIFGVPPADPATFNGPAFSLGGNIDALYASLFATNATYTESAMSFMTPPNATDLSAVRNRGGKILVYHGVSDPIFSVADTAAWYDGVTETSGGYAGNFARLFRVPGMGHCAGGPATDQFDVITPLVAWVEQGVAPRRILATARGAGNAGGVNAEVPAAWAADRTRPLCPYPRVARYQGFGDVEAADSWRCR